MNFIRLRKRCGRSQNNNRNSAENNETIRQIRFRGRWIRCWSWPTPGLTKNSSNRFGSVKNGKGVGFIDHRKTERSYTSRFDI